MNDYYPCQVCGKDSYGNVYWYKPSEHGLLNVVDGIGFERICEYCKAWSETVFVKKEE